MRWLANWQVRLGIALVVASIVVYSVHYLIFHDAHHIFIYLVGDIAFVPMEVLLVTLVIHGLLTFREKRSLLRKLNMVIAAFFNEMGVQLMGRLAAFDQRAEELKQNLVMEADWSDKDFQAAARNLKAHKPEIDSRTGDLVALRELLTEKRPFVLRLLENPNLLEHESFTNLLWAVSHLTEELHYRNDLTDLPTADYGHLSGDINRAYVQLISEWLAYTRHLRDDYPYLYSLAVRTNPFDPDASAVVQ